MRAQAQAAHRRRPSAKYVVGVRIRRVDVLPCLCHSSELGMRRDGTVALFLDEGIHQ